jgi:alkylation response protein AidB-like acyl-CoA dehydrogenase
MFNEIPIRFQRLTITQSIRNNAAETEIRHMNNNVVFLHGQPAPIGHYIRIGTSAYRQFETLLGAGRMPINSVVVEAAVCARRSRKGTFRRSSIPEAWRSQHFLDHELADANRVAQKAARIRTNDEALRETLLRSGERLERMSLVLEDLQRAIGHGPRSACPHRRIKSANRSARKW